MDGQSNETMVDEHPNPAVVARAGGFEDWDLASSLRAGAEKR